LDRHPDIVRCTLKESHPLESVDPHQDYCNGAKKSLRVLQSSNMHLKSKE
jgi:hypothetical protein